MKSEKLYEQLEKDFVEPEMWDEWAEYMDPISDYLTDQFKERSIGLVCDNTDEIKEVYTAVFPEKKVMKEVIGKSEGNSLLFMHHPSIWDINQDPPFQLMDEELLEKFQDKQISIYILHVPLDNYSEYSTGRSLAEALEIKVKEPFAEYRGGKSGVIGKTKAETLEEQAKILQKTIGHEVGIYPYGDKEIKDQKIGLVTGGGLMKSTLKELNERDINTFITGLTARNDHSEENHEYAEEKEINLLGGTHYSTEKFACKKIREYFEEKGLPARFIEGEPVMEDL